MQLSAKEVLEAWAKMLNVPVKKLGEGEFFFSRFETPEALDQAWSYIPEHLEIRKRVKEVKGVTPSAEELGGIPMYSFPKVGYGLDTLKDVAEAYLAALLPLAEREPGYEATKKLIQNNPKVILGNPDEVPSPIDFNHELYEIHTDPILENLPREAHYYILYNYAVYLTKDDRVAAYVLWPCLKNKAPLENVFRLGFEIWRRRAQFWTDEKRERIYVGVEK